MTRQSYYESRISGIPDPGPLDRRNLMDHEVLGASAGVQGEWDQRQVILRFHFLAVRIQRYVTCER
jgi:hypothetical protein